LQPFHNTELSARCSSQTSDSYKRLLGRDRSLQIAGIGEGRYSASDLPSGEIYANF
ncbi:hypothetical protein T12_12557, partial [Trichinella patagoniensis]